MHAGTVGIEDAGDLDLKSVLAMVIEEQRFCASLALVITRTRSDRIDVTPVIFSLRMNDRIAINFTGRRLQHLASQALGKPQHIDRTMDGSFGGLDRIVLIMHR